MQDAANTDLTHVLSDIGYSYSSTQIFLNGETLENPRCDENVGSNLLTCLIGRRGLFLEAAAAITGSRSMAEDVLQDVALRLCERSISGEIANPVGFLRRMIRNLAVDYIRRRSVDPEFSADASAIEALVAPCTCPLHRIETCEALCAVAAALRDLPDRTRSAFVAHRFEGEPQKSIAVRLRVSPTLVNFMMRDATAKCRAASDRVAS